MGWGDPEGQAASLEAEAYGAGEFKEIAAFLQLNNVAFVLRAPVYAQRLAGQDGRLFYGAGMIHSMEEVGRAHV